MVIAVHAAAFASCYLLAFLVRFDGNVPPDLRILVAFTTPIVVGLKMGAILLAKVHRGWWSSASFADLSRMAEAVSLGSIAVFAVFAAWGSSQAPSTIARSVLLIDWAGSLVGLCCARGLMRLFRERYRPMLTDRRRVLITDAGEAGQALARQVAARPDLGLKVVGFVDIDTSTHGAIVGGAPVLGGLAGLSVLAKRHRVQTVLIPTPAVPPAVIRALSLECKSAGLAVQVVPGFDSLLSGALQVRPRDVDVQDLLCRPPVDLGGDAVADLISDRVVLVTGAAGSIGSEIARQVLSLGPRCLILLDHSENGLFHLARELGELAPRVEIRTCVASIRDAPRLRSVFGRHHPQVVFHAAAHKHVPLMEENPGEAVKNNVLGTRVVVDESLRAGVRAFVMISTDKAVKPSSTMGACKRLAELYVQLLSGLSSARLVTVRFGNVLGSNGSVVPIFQEQIRRGGPVTVTHRDMTRYFMTITEAARLVLQSGAQGRGGEIFVLDMGEPVRILDMARDMIRLTGHVEGAEISIAFTGLRPGEKLTEELYEEGEAPVPTLHPKIFATRHRPYAWDRLQEGLDRLASIADGPEAEIVALLRELVDDSPSESAASPPEPMPVDEPAHSPPEWPVRSPAHGISCPSLA